MAASPIPDGLTRIGTGQLSLLTPKNLSTISIGRVAHCKHPDDPDQFTSSLNYTFPRTPSISESSLRAAGIDPNDDTYSFDCFLEIPPAGVVTFEIKGSIDSNLRLVFEVWYSVLIFNYEGGVYSCELLDLDKDPCAFTIDKKYIKGQAGLFPQLDSDPGYIDLCFEIHATVSVPYTRVKKTVNFEKCFYKFPKNGTVDA